jgi:hypothetical protein
MNVRRRKPRITMNGKGLRYAGIGIAAIVAAIGLLTVVVGVVLFIAGKADRSEVQAVDRRVQSVETDVKVIKSEQRMFIKAIRPDLAVGEE